jgi:RES domain-containing protein
LFVRLFRIADERFGPDSAEGARLFGGRWNSPGRAVIYTCTTYTGAMLEKLVRTGRQIPKHQVCVVFEAPDDVAATDSPLTEAAGWDSKDLAVSRRVGDEWVTRSQTAILYVPSAVFAIEKNALINPAHSDAKRIRVVSIEPIRWDDRLFVTKAR